MAAGVTEKLEEIADVLALLRTRTERRTRPQTPVQSETAGSLGSS